MAERPGLPAVALGSLHAALLCWCAGAEAQSLSCLAQTEFPVDQRTAFVERQHLPLLREPMVREGIAWVDGAGAVIMQVHAPRLEERRIERNRLVLLRPSRGPHASHDAAFATAKTLHLTLDPRRPTHLALWAAARVLAGESAALDERFETASGAGPPGAAHDCSGAWTVELLPRNAKTERALHSIHLQGRGKRLEALRIDQGEHGRREISLAPPPSDAVAPGPSP